MTWKVEQADCIDAMRDMDEASVDAIVCDPPYGLEFMGKEWDRLAGDWRTDLGRGEHAAASGRPSGKRGFDGHPPTPRFHAGKTSQDWHEAWATEALRVLKPGGHLLAFGGTRTSHRLACAIEDAGFEIRDSLIWLQGSGFPKSRNVSRDLEDVRCVCDGESTAERDLRPMREADVSTALDAQDQRGEVLLSGVSESGASAELLPGATAVAGSSEPGLEGRGDVLAEGGQLPADQVRSSAGVGDADGSERRLHHGASARDGAADRPTTDASGDGASPESRPARQRGDEPRTVADEPGSQARGTWPLCGRCGKPRIPSGLGTALKPGHEPIVMARKPLVGTVARNVVEHGAGALNIDGCRVGHASEADLAASQAKNPGRDDVVTSDVYGAGRPQQRVNTDGRWPANVVLSHTEDCNGECAEGCPVRELDEQSGKLHSQDPATRNSQSPRSGVIGFADGGQNYGDTGGASRFYYTAKASRAERNAGLEGMPAVPTRGNYGDGIQDSRPHTREGYEYRARTQNVHPTVKPLALMRWLCRLVTPPDGLILDPFAGSGTTGCAAVLEGFDFIGVEREAEYVEIARARIAYWADPKAHEARLAEAERDRAEAQAEETGQPVQLGLLG